MKDIKLFFVIMLFVLLTGCVAADSVNSRFYKKMVIGHNIDEYTKNEADFKKVGYFNIFEYKNINFKNKNQQLTSEICNYFFLLIIPLNFWDIQLTDTSKIEQFMSILAKTENKKIIGFDKISLSEYYVATFLLTRSCVKFSGIPIYETDSKND